jgi:hypothetical protein
MNDQTNPPKFDAALAVEQLHQLKASKKAIEEKHRRTKPWKEGIEKSNYCLGSSTMNTRALRPAKYDRPDT